MTQLIDNTYETGKKHKNFIEVTNIALKKSMLQNAATIAQSASLHILQR
jgi:hypothetical protein